jgi:hypothetical protein
MHNPLLKNPPTDAALLERFDETGYLVIRSAVRPEVILSLSAWVYGELENQKDSFRSQLGFDLDDCDAMVRYGQWLSAEGGRFEALPRDLQHLVKGEFPLPVRLNKDLLDITEQEPLTEAVHLLLDESGLRMHYPPMLRFKYPGQRQAVVPLHQDHPYFPHLSRFVISWLPFCPITEARGGVNVLEGSHRLGPVAHDTRILWGHTVAGAPGLDSYPDRHIVMEPGDVLLMSPYLLHYTHANTSPDVRCSMDCRWFGPETDPTRQYYDLSAREVVQVF